MVQAAFLHIDALIHIGWRGQKYSRIPLKTGLRAGVDRGRQPNCQHGPVSSILLVEPQWRGRKNAGFLA
jgi:hypothetical protein